MTVALPVAFASQPPAVVGTVTSLQFEAVSKRFTLEHAQARSFQEAWIRLIHRRRDPSREDFWALNNVSFEVHAGEMLGVIGRNGSGKSTLLRVAARTVRPTTGRVLIRGRVTPLLELGAGFHPELSGRDNIYLNGSVLGLSRAEISDRYADIVGFAELEHFIDTPLKHYSSGMWLRLGFGVAVYTDADILLIDETLAVGDAQFQAKCFDRIAELRNRGTTILLVSHDLGLVSTMCDRALWLESGSVRAAGQASTVVAEYQDGAEPARVGEPRT
ncbi:MAG: ABC transporter ATP-binding protein [Chloroflexi bacterium]|nr:ABC transporter ATP-binding protein [Chloroflexota bacterium]